jgi:agmatine deiminase
MPAEWEPHGATWLSWPHNHDTWPGKFETVEPVYSEMVRALATSETVLINVLNPAHREHVESALEGIEGDIRLLELPTNDAWCRDHGAIFVRGASGGPVSAHGSDSRDQARARELATALDRVAAVDFVYNGWGGKYPPYDRDAVVAATMAERCGVKRLASPLVLEGGALDVNGKGILMTTGSCVLNPNRNPGLSREAAEAEFARLLGTHTTLWVEGDLQGDDTDGHIDNLARFVSPTDILMVVATDPLDSHFEVLRGAFEMLSADASRLGVAVHALPLPGAVMHEGHRLPASHANFYVGNRVVLLPTYGGPSDREAEALLQRFFPSRRIVPIDCTDLVWGLGAFHCLTQQVPQGVPLP